MFKSKIKDCNTIVGSTFLDSGTEAAFLTLIVIVCTT